MTEQTNSSVQYTQDADGVVTLTLDMPGRSMNVLNDDLTKPLADALARIEGDAAVKGVILTSGKKEFLAGADIEKLFAMTRAEQAFELAEKFKGFMRRLELLGRPVVAALNGTALGGGMELALACDIVLARDDAKLGQPEITLGVFPPVAAALLPRLIGRQRAMDLILTGRTVTAAEAATLGLVSRVIAADTFADAVSGVAGKLAGLSGAALRLAKRALIAGLDCSADLAIARAESLYLTELVAQPDAHEGIAAFLAKRPPVWRS